MHYPRIRKESQGKSKNRSQHSWCHSRDWKWAHPECEPEGFPAEPSFSVKCSCFAAIKCEESVTFNQNITTKPVAEIGTGLVMFCSRRNITVMMVKFNVTKDKSILVLKHLVILIPVIMHYHKLHLLNTYHPRTSHSVRAAVIFCISISYKI
jgi:hypothetical protein